MAAGPSAAALGSAGSKDGAGRVWPSGKRMFTVVWRSEDRVRPHRDASRSQAEGQSSTSVRSPTEQGFSPGGTLSGERVKGTASWGRRCRCLCRMDEHPDPSCSLPHRPVPPRTKACVTLLACPQVASDVFALGQSLLCPWFCPPLGLRRLCWVVCVWLTDGEEGTVHGRSDGPGLEVRRRRLPTFHGGCKLTATPSCAEARAEMV